MQAKCLYQVSNFSGERAIEYNPFGMLISNEREKRVSERGKKNEQKTSRAHLRVMVIARAALIVFFIAISFSIQVY